VKLRPYQEECLAAIYAYLEKEKGHCCASIATGLGKSLIAAKICQWALSHVSNAVVYVVVPTQELCEQNYGEMLEVWPDAPAGIYCAGLGRKEKRQLIFGTIQSLYRAKAKLPKADLLVADECDGIPHSSEGMWRNLISFCEKRDPDFRVIGLTATPFRMSSGRLDEGDEKLFDKVVYEYGVKEGIESGYLSPLITKDTDTKLDTSDVKMRGGDFIESELQKAVDRDDLNYAVVEESIKRAGDRKWWLFFCCGIEHSEHIAAILREKGIAAEALSSLDSKPERKRKIDGFRAGDIQALCSTNILTRGFNVKGVSFISMLRPTRSPALFIQCLGRGTRLHESKKDCLVADFSGNLLHFGPIDKITGRKKKGSGDAPLKVCPGCDSVIPISHRTCPDCGHAFPIEEKQKFSSKASTAAILSTDEDIPQELEITSIKYGLHQKEGRPECMKITYQCGLFSVYEFIHFEININRAERWWKARTHLPLPKNARQALVFRDRLAKPARIVVKKNGKYWNVERHIWSNVASAGARQGESGGTPRSIYSVL